MSNKKPIVQIDSEFSRMFSLNVWNTMSDTDRLPLADYLSEKLVEHGWQIDEVPTLQTFGPRGDQQTVLQIREARWGMTFSLIPGGTFRPGYSQDLLEEFNTVWFILQAWDYQLDQTEDDDVVIDLETLEPELAEHRIVSYLACGPLACDIRAKKPVQVEPLLMATELLMDETPDAGELVTNQWARRTENYYTSRGGKKGYYPLQLMWSEVAPVNESMCWDLPSSVEFEWALRGGKDSLFYWGNTIPKWLCKDQGAKNVPAERITNSVSFDDLMKVRFSPKRPRKWPWCNRFGLAAMLPTGTWCKKIESAKARNPLVTRGGPADCYPWQCREWVGFLNAIERRLPSNSENSHEMGIRAALRPVVRLVS